MRSSVLAAAAGLLFVPLVSRADLTGNTVNVTYEDTNTMPTTAEDDGQVVVPGATFADGGQFTISVFGSLITVTADSAVTFDGPNFNGFVITDTTMDPMITDVTTGFESLTSGTVTPTFTSDSVSLNFAGDTVNAGDFAIVDLAFAATPEPSSFALLGTGLVGVAGVMRRRFVRS